MAEEMEEGGAREERKKLLDIATDMIKELQRITKPVNALINMLIGEADQLTNDAADEHEAARGTIARKMTYKKLVENGRPPKVQTMSEAGEVVEKGQRRCGLCDQVGHNARTCPNGRSEKEEKPSSKSKVRYSSVL